MSKLTEVFHRQLEMIIQFHRIEDDNAMLDYDQPIPFDLFDRYAQKQLRSTAWYLVEEVSEMLMAEATSAVTVHEEIVDVFHFMVELLICSGVTLKQLEPNLPQHPGDALDQIFDTQTIATTQQATANFIRNLGWAIHELKGKPWKANPKVVNPKTYRSRMINTFYAFVALAKSYGMSSHSLYNMYLGKAAVNQERIVNGN